MTAQELLAQNPLLAQGYNDYKNAGQPGTPEEWLAGFGDQGSLLALGYDSQSNLAASKAQQKAINEGGNTSSVQQGAQSGSFQSTGQTTQTGTQTQTQSGTQQALDTLGFGELLKGQAGNAQAADTANRGFLTDLVQTGGQGFQSQVDQAARKALSGPGMLGTGVGAQGRVAGSAVADVARNNAGLRLQAAQQLAGPTAVGTLAAAGNPFIGQKTDQTSVGVQDLVSNETQSGTSKANTNQTALGNQPTQSGGGCYVSSVLAIRGQIGKRVIRAAVRYKASQSRFRFMVRGYSFYGSRLAEWVDSHPAVHGLFRSICRQILYQELRWSGRKLKWKLGPVLLHAVFHYGSSLTGRLFSPKSVTPAVPSIEQKLKSHDLYFFENYES